MNFERIWHKSYSPGVLPEIAIEQVTMAEALSRSALVYPQVDALIYMGKHITFGTLDRLVNRCARALTDLGVKKGDTVAMLLPNVPEVVIANFAVFRLGAVTGMNNPLYTERELIHQLNDQDAEVIVTLDLLVPRIMKIKDQTKLKTVIACHINDYLPFPKKQLFPFLKKAMYRNLDADKDVIEFQSLIKRYPDAPLPNEARWDGVAAMLYTGGTTGVSKGVMLTHANLSSNIQQFKSLMPEFKQGQERMLAIFPFFHAAGFTGMQNFGMFTGSTLILVPRPDTETIVEQIRQFKPTFVAGVPTIFTGLLNHPAFKRLDLSFIKLFLCGAAPLPVPTIKGLNAMTGAVIANVYGMTETTPFATASPVHAILSHDLSKCGTVGLPIPNTDLKIVDVESGTTEMPPGVAGEICFKGPQVMLGYYKRPEETAAVLHDGWLFTGDIGMLDEDGYLTIVDRKKDLIIASGFNIYPKEIDEVLYEHPKILEACTIGVPDEYRGETVKAFVVIKPGESLSAEEVIQFCKERLTAYKVPKKIEFLEELPKSAVGKVLRRELKERELKNQMSERGVECARS